MMIDIVHFTPGLSFAGGLLIGLAAIGLALFCGRIAGISGILGSVIARHSPDRLWCIAFLAGLVIAPLVVRLFTTLPPVHIEASWPVILIAGVLVGIGTRLGSGCTSGHGVCGLSRLSLRSLAATVTFMAAGFAMATLIGYWL